jgi:hypothetical protein
MEIFGKTPGKTANIGTKKFLVTNNIIFWQAILYFYKGEISIMIRRIKDFYKKNQEELPDLALIILFLTPFGMTFANESTHIWMFIAWIFIIAGWLSATYNNPLLVIVSLVILWTVAYISTITEWDDYGYGIGTIILIINLPYWLFAKHGFRKLLKESKNKKG